MERISPSLSIWYCVILKNSFILRAVRSPPVCSPGPLPPLGRETLGRGGGNHDLWCEPGSNSTPLSFSRILEYLLVTPLLGLHGKSHCAVGVMTIYISPSLDHHLPVGSPGVATLLMFQ